MEPNYHQEIVKSPYHLYGGLATLGLGLLAGNLVGLIIGVVAYIAVWLFMPDMPFFKKWVDDRFSAKQREADQEQIKAFEEKRKRILDGLNKTNQAKYWGLVDVCKEIERSGVDSATFDDPTTDPRLRKLDELMWTYLRLLNTEEALQRFLSDENQQDLPHLVEEGRNEIASLKEGLDKLRTTNDPQVSIRERFYNSRFERLAVLEKRLERIEQAKGNLSLISAEQERLLEQIKLIRSDTVASKNADAFTTRIDASVEHLDETNGLLRELGDFKDLTSDDIPAPTTARVGYGVSGGSSGVSFNIADESPRRARKAVARF